MNPIAAAWIGLALLVAGTGVWVNRAQAKAEKRPKLSAPRSLSEGEGDTSGVGAPMTLFPGGTVESVFGGPVMTPQLIASAPATTMDSPAAQSMTTPAALPFLREQAARAEATTYRGGGMPRPSTPTYVPPPRLAA